MNETGSCATEGLVEMETLKNNKTTLEVHDPAGLVEATGRRAAGLGDLKGKTIGFLSNGVWESERVLTLVAELLARRVPGVRIIPYTDMPTVEDVDQFLENIGVIKDNGCDAVILGNAG